MNYYSFVCSTFITFLVCVAPAHAWPARVVAVADGDTITVEPVAGGDRVKIRLHGIDAPERKQPFGEAARSFVFDVALYEMVEVEDLGRDAYGRSVAVVWMAEGETLQAALLRVGLAWVWPRYCPDCPAWEALQNDARQAGRGLWAAPGVPPWEWRRGTR